MLALLFNIFLNDLLYFVKVAKTSNYAEDNQLYYSHQDPNIVEDTINDELKIVCDWSCSDKLTSNDPEKCKALIVSINQSIVND